MLPPLRLRFAMLTMIFHTPALRYAGATMLMLMLRAAFAAMPLLPIFSFAIAALIMLFYTLPLLRRFSYAMLFAFATRLSSSYAIIFAVHMPYACSCYASDAAVVVAT